MEDNKSINKPIGEEMAELKCDECYTDLFNACMEALKLCSGRDFKTQREAALQIFENAYENFPSCISRYTHKQVDKTSFLTSIKTILTERVDALIQANNRIRELH